MNTLLQGIKVMDMTSVFMGPHAAQILAEYGAQVTKIEPPEGDIVRHIGPARHAGMGPQFLGANRGKLSIVLDLKRPAAVEIALRLAARSDVLLYNVRPKAMARLGLDYERVRALNPRVVYVGALGFGRSGPYADRPAYDDLIQGLSGLASLPQRVNGGEPRYVPSAIVDRAVALAVVNAVLAALMKRERTGRGQAVDVPMFETMASLVLGDHLSGATFEPPLAPPGYARHLAPDRRPYATKDGYICALVYSDKQWHAFFDLIGAPELKHDARFRDMASRGANIQAVYQFLAEMLATRTTQEWLEELARADIPAARMHTLESLLGDPHLAASGFFEIVEHPSEGKLRQMRHPAAFSDGGLAPLTPAPRLGEHSREILRELGYETSAIDALIREGVTTEPVS